MGHTDIMDNWNTVRSLVKRSWFKRAASWSIGISPRLSSNRIGRLLQERRFEELDAFLQTRDASRIKSLRVYAAANQEQAAAALRMTVIVNVSIPVIFLTLTTQVSDGRFWERVWGLYEGETNVIAVWATALSLTFLLLALLLISGASRLGDARDMRHLIDLHAAERGIYFGLEDSDEFQSQ